MKSIGQIQEVWKEAWDKTSPEKEIRRWDYFGGRQYISKYIPRYGKTLEAGCGLGRYVFYFAKMGINIDGIDFSKKTIDYLNKWQKQYNFNFNFQVDDVTKLSYPDNSLRGYISLGVVEHFIEGPKKPLDEAYRVLEPGGIAIITTPSVSWYVTYMRVKAKLKEIVKKIIRYKSPPRNFFQYEYKPKQLKKFVEKSGLYVTQFSGADLLFPYTQKGKFTGKNIKKGSFAYWFSHKFENTILKNIGAQSITISVKVADEMYCFLCGDKTAKKKSLLSYTVPICKKCTDKDTAHYYKLGNYPKYSAPYIINPPIKAPVEEVCELSGEIYISDELFEDFGLAKNISPQMLQKPEVNIKLCNENIQPIWRNFK